MVKKMFIEIRLCNLTTYVFKGHVKIVKMYMAKFNESISNRPKIMGFFVNTKKNKHNVIFNKTVTKIVTILTKKIFPYLNPTSYLNALLMKSVSASLKWYTSFEYGVT